MTDDPGGDDSREQKLHDVLAAYYEAAEKRSRSGPAYSCSTAIPSSPPSSLTFSPSKMKCITWRSRFARWFQNGRNGGDPSDLNLTADCSSSAPASRPCGRRQSLDASATTSYRA